MKISRKYTFVVLKMQIFKKTQQVKKKRNNAATPQNNAAAFKTQAMGTLL